MSQSPTTKKRAYATSESDSSETESQTVDVETESQTVDIQAEEEKSRRAIERAVDELSGADARERIRLCVDTVMAYIGVDGAHHKQWALLESLRRLVGQSTFDLLMISRTRQGYETDNGVP